jgi:hypothetical protein
MAGNIANRMDNLSREGRVELLRILQMGDERLERCWDEGILPRYIDGPGRVLF